MCASAGCTCRVANWATTRHVLSWDSPLPTQPHHTTPHVPSTLHTPRAHTQTPATDHNTPHRNTNPHTPRTHTQVVLLGAVSTMFPGGEGGGGEGGSGSGPTGWAALGGVASTFLYLFTTSLVLGISTGMAISILVVRFAQHGPHHVRQLVVLEQGMCT